MIDVVIPDNNEEEFIEMAKKIGTKGLIFLYKNNKKTDLAKLSKKHKMPLYKGVLATTPNKAKTYKKKADLVFGLGTRNMFENKSVDAVFPLVNSERKDFLHHRNSGMNQVLAKIAKDKTIIYSFNDVLKTAEIEVVLGRLMQNTKLCRKYKLKTAIASFAEKPYEMRYYKDLISFGITVGMHPSEAKKAVNIFENL